MQQIPLQAVPNQAFSVIFDNNRWDFAIKTTVGQTSVSLSRNGIVLLENARAVAGAFIIPSQYEEAGNFIFSVQSFQLPAYPRFGVTQYLIYVSAEELDILRAPVAPPITAADFNPIADLPLRFSPQGYS